MTSSLIPAQDGGARPSEEIARECDQYRERLRRSVDLRLDPRVRGRVDASDVVQETLVEAVERYHEYEERGDGSLYFWLRFLAHQKLLQARRFHLETAKRSVRCERSIERVRAGGSDCGALADYMIAAAPSPSSACSRRETRDLVVEAIESLPDLDREVLALRCFEELSNAETAAVLEIDPSTASTRFLRALRRVRRVLGPDLDG